MGVAVINNPVAEHDFSSDEDQGGEPMLLKLPVKTTLARKIQEDYNNLADIISGADNRGSTLVSHYNIAIDTVRDLISFVIRSEKVFMDWYEAGRRSGNLGQLPTMAGGVDETDVQIMFANGNLALPKYQTYHDQDRALYDATKRVIEIVEMAARDKILLPTGLYYEFSLAKWVECNIYDLIRSASESIERTF